MRNAGVGALVSLVAAVLSPAVLGVYEGKAGAN